MASLIKEPFTKITTTDYSRVYGEVDDSLNLGMVIDSPTGRLDITKLTSVSQLVDNYLNKSALTADDHITVQHAAKLLQFMPIHVTRAVTSNVFPARSDKIDVSGDSNLFTDKDYQPYYKHYQAVFSRADNASNRAYVVVDSISDNVLLSTEDGDLVETESGELIRVEGIQTAARFCVYIADAGVAVDPSTEFGFTEDKSITSININELLKEDHEPTLENVFKYFNAAVSVYNQTAPNKCNYLTKINISDNYIGVNMGLNLKIVKGLYNSEVKESYAIYPVSNTSTNISTQNYLGLSFSDVFTGDKAILAKKNSKDDKVEDGITSSSYYNMNGQSFYLQGAAGNEIYPGTSYPIRVYSGFGNTYNVDQFIERYFSVQDFFVYYTDDQFRNGVIKPELNMTSVKSVVGFYSNNDNTIDGVDYTKKLGNDVVKKIEFLDTDGDWVYKVHSIDCEFVGDPKLKDYLVVSNNVDVNGNQKSYVVSGSDGEHGSVNIALETNPNTWIMNNAGIKLAINYIRTEDDNEANIKTKYLYFVVGKVADADFTSDTAYVMSDVCTVNKFVYRIAEFFSRNNPWLSNNYGMSSLYDLSVSPKKDDDGNSIANSRIYQYTSRSNVLAHPEFVELTDGSKSTSIGGISIVTIDEENVNKYIHNVVLDEDYLLLYLKSDKSSNTTNIKYISYDLLPLSEMTDLDIVSYSINSTESNEVTKSYIQQAIKITRYMDGAEPLTYIFFNGMQWFEVDQNTTAIQISTARLTYTEFMNLFISYSRNYLNATYIVDGIRIFEKDALTRITFETMSADELDPMFGDRIDLLDHDYTELWNNSALVVVSKLITNDNELRFTITQSEKDPEIYNFTYMRDATSNEYSISFNPGKVADDGTSIYYEYVNDLDKDFYLMRINETPSNVPMTPVNSGMWGASVMVGKTNPIDYKFALERFKDFDGTYYDFIFDGGYSNTQIASAIESLCESGIYSQALHSMPDVFDPDQLKRYRKSVGIDHWHGQFCAPRVNDTTVGEYVVSMSPQIEYLKRVVTNKSAGKEFAPVFSKNNGISTLPPKYKYDNKAIREDLLNNQINLIIYDKARQLSYFNLNLTSQSKDTMLSDENNCRMVNCIAHVCDEVAENYKSRFNTVATRLEFISEVKTAIENRVKKNQEYTYNDLKLICDTTNNTPEIINARKLVMDVAIQFIPGIRYIYIYQGVYGINQTI